MQRTLLGSVALALAVTAIVTAAQWALLGLAVVVVVSGRQRRCDTL